MRKHFNIIMLQAILVALFLTSCSQQNKNVDTANDFTLIKKSEIQFPVDSTSSFLTNNLGIDENGLFYFRDVFNDKINFFNNSAKLVRTIKIPTYGPNSIPKPSGIKLLSNDSLIIFQRQLRVNYTNYNFDTLRTDDIKIPMISVSSPLNMPAFSISSYPEIFGDKIYFIFSPIFADGHPLAMYSQVETRSTLISRPMVASVEIGSNQVQWENIFYPPMLLNMPIHGMSNRIYSTRKDDKLIISFLFSHEIQIFDPQTKEKEYTELKSKYEIDLVSKNAERTPQGASELVETNYIYSQIIYDPYRKLFYRTVLHPAVSYDGIPQRRTAAEDPRGFSIIIADENFNKLGEVDFPGSKYFYQAWFVGPEGLYISTNNLNNPDMSEDWLSFDIFAVEELLKD